MPGQTFLSGNIKFKGGPHIDWRYVKLADGKVLDMRHVLVVGMTMVMGNRVGESLGGAGEIAQYFTDKSSFNKRQDYYSNKIGVEFLIYLQKNSLYFDPRMSTSRFGKTFETKLSQYFYNFIKSQ